MGPGMTTDLLLQEFFSRSETEPEPITCRSIETTVVSPTLSTSPTFGPSDSPTLHEPKAERMTAHSNHLP